MRDFHQPKPELHTERRNGYYTGLNFPFCILESACPLCGRGEGSSFLGATSHGPQFPIFTPKDASPQLGHQLAPAQLDAREPPLPQYIQVLAVGDRPTDLTLLVKDCLSQHKSHDSLRPLHGKELGQVPRLLWLSNADPKAVSVRRVLVYINFHLKLEAVFFPNRECTGEQ